jgi:nucleotide-binding universal stress UspA family protein
MNPIRKILCPVDFDEGSRAALASARELARLFAAERDVVHVVALPYRVRPDLMVWMEAGDVRPVIDVARDQAGSSLEEWLREAGAAPDEVGRDLLIGDPADAILERALQGGYDLIVMGTHGRSGMSRLLLGSVAEKVVRRSPRPVLTVHREHLSTVAA